MKKKLEAELISIAHRILKLKNRSELDQLQAETLKLYEKISVLRFVEDNFADVKPTIGYASAEGKLEEIYGIEEVPEVHANEVEAAEDKARAEKKSPPTPQEGEAEGSADPTQKVEEYQASEGEKEQSPPAREGGDEEADEKPEEVEEPAKEEKPEVKEPEVKEEKKEEATEEPENKVEVVKPEAEVKAMEESAAAVFEKEDNATIAEEEKAADAEVVTIEPDANAKTDKSDVGFDFAFERTPAPEEPKKQKEISFEDFHDYKEPEFIKKDEKKVEPPKSGEPKKEEPKAEADDWRNWEPNKQSQAQPLEEKTEEPKAEEEDNWRNWEPKKDPQPEIPKEEPKQEAPKPTMAAEPATSRPISESFGKTITLGLNDRIAFEKNLFGGSSEDLNRVVSQINTQNSYDEAKAFIEDLVKPDYNNWVGKEDYETRFMELVEKRFS
ncbi:hypothetical protein [Flavobacterium sp.]|uniref:hypothetical protein n=1 Tax=Flavobacterium sp. TaxID=239 RepID=UPI004033BCBC